MLRTHTCDQITEELKGKKVTLCGWVHSRRDHGKLIFIDIRDRYGKVQAVFTPKPHSETYAIAKDLRSEDVIRIMGDITPRPNGTINEKIPSGRVELFANELSILSHSQDLPFMPDESSDAQEEVRLLHRYIDLRRRSVLERFIVRHRCNHAFRNFLHQKHFLEIETPFLTKSTPEGARDFLVPSRLNVNRFYALPQSPQLFKQILMVSGIDKYYQIVKCFRDEDLRKDRQPEFSQLDMEMSFVDEEDIYSLTEKMFYAVFKEVLGVELVLPFGRISYTDAIKQYATDSPDIGSGRFRFVWVVDFPLFEYSEERKRFESHHHPFTAPHPDDLKHLDGDLARVRSRSYDLVLNGQEIASGSIRIHAQDVQEKIFKLIGIEKKEAKERFGFLLRAFKHGVPPHGGIAFGLDRLYAIITGSESIREVIAFPKTQKGVCPLTAAPSTVDSAQLEELAITIIEKEESE